MKKAHLLVMILACLLGLVLLSCAAADDERTIRYTEGHVTKYADDGTVLERTAFPLQNTYVQVRDDVTLVRETHPDQFTGVASAGSILLGGNGCTVLHAESTSEPAAGQKVLVVETDGRLTGFKSAGYESGSGRLTVGEKLEPQDYIQEFVSEEGGVRSSKPTINLAGTYQVSKDIDVEIEEGGIWIHYDADFEPYYWGYEYTVNKFSTELTLKGVVVKISKPGPKLTLKLGHFSVELVPGLAEADFTPKLFVEAKAEGEVGFNFSIEEGIGFKITGYVYLVPVVSDIHRVSAGPSAEFIGANIGGEVYAGLEWGPGLDVLEGVVSADLSYAGGVAVKGRLPLTRFDPSDGDKLRWHICEPGKCVQGEVCPRIGPLATSIEIAGETVYQHRWVPEMDFDPFGEFYYSFTYGDGAATACPHYANKLIVTARDQNGAPLSNVDVTYDPADSKVTEVASGKTNGEGQVILYVPTKDAIKESTTKNDPNTVTVSGFKTIEGRSFDAVATVTEKGISSSTHRPDPEEATLEFDLHKCKITFRSELEGTENMPQPVEYFPDKNPNPTGVVHLPVTIPTHAGKNFYAWKDSNNVYYAPGAAIPAEDRNLELTADWLDPPLEQAYTIIFDPNRGTGGLQYDTVEFNVASYVIPNDNLPTRAGFNFVGWAFTNDADGAQFIAGQPYSNDVLNPDSKRSVRLYAVWSISPTDYVKLMYDMNGGPKDQTPPTQFAPPGSKLKIPNLIPYWSELYTFGGWSEDPASLDKVYMPGDSILIQSGEVTLYAVWKLKPMPGVCKVEFIDSDGRASGMPRTILFVKPEEGAFADVTLPAAVPEKKGMDFEGWCMKEDGSGVLYQPGEVLRLDNDLKLYAIWSIHPAILQTIRFNANGGAGTMENQYGPYRETVELKPNEFSRSGYFFRWWNTREDGHGQRYPDRSAVTLWTDLDLYADWKEIFHYAVTGAEGDIHYRRSGEDAVFTVKRSRRDEITYGSFVAAAVDHRRISRENYTIAPGSLKLTLKDSFLDTLSDGTHLVSFRFRDGETEATVTVTTPVPRTGDGANVPLWMGLILLGLIGLGGAAAVRHRK